MATKKPAKEKTAAKPKRARAGKAVKPAKTSAKTSSIADDYRLKTADELADQLVKLKKEASISASSAPTVSSRRQTGCVRSAGQSRASKLY
jgi:hypothetical protein